MTTRFRASAHYGIFAILALSLLLVPNTKAASELPVVVDVPWQPFAAQVKRLIEATDYLGTPLSDADKAALREAFEKDDKATSIREIQSILDPYCLVGVRISPESRVKVKQGPASPELVEQGWRQFLVKVRNEAGVTARLDATSPNAGSLAGSSAESVADRWLGLQMFENQPLKRNLSGLQLQYRIIQLYSRDAGKREAELRFDVGQGTQDIGFRNQVDILFNCRPANKITLRVLDSDGNPTTAGFEIRDQYGRVYPSQAKRLEPDFAFHPQVYRADGETVKLPDGTYNVRFRRGPETIPQTETIQLNGEDKEVRFRMKRWVDPAERGWWSGDHHIHAAGCAHYREPTKGVRPPAMARHCRGEDLKIGANLTWGPCFDFQKQFFTGAVHPISDYPFLLRYDIEVSGFGSHRSGHLCLLRLKQQIYPGGDSKHHWPTLGLNTLKWAKKQGALVGPAHSGWGLEVDTDKLPNYIVPPYNGIGANEYIVDVTHKVTGPDGSQVPAVDFMSLADTPSVWELNMWYQTLNVGFRTRVSGETDFPCIYGERVGLGRSYVKLDEALTYEAWCEGIRQGHNYVSDGRSHLFDFQINGVDMASGNSELELSEAETVHVSLEAAARLEKKPNPEIGDRPYDHKPYWHIERARIGETRTVPVEVIVNGYPVDRQVIKADGSTHSIDFDIPIEQSSWVAVRILPSSHTNPIFVIVDDQPIRASRRSAKWCLEGVDQCWSQKQRFIDEDEMEDAKAAYAHAREVYRTRLSESVAE